MKKFVLVLIVCILLCASLCLLLAGCNSSDAKDETFNSNETKIELIELIYHNNQMGCICRVWYPLKWLVNDYGNLSIGYKLPEDDELSSVSYYAEFVTDVHNSDSHLMVPDSWLYVVIADIPQSAKSVYIEVSCDILVAGNRQTEIMAQSTFALT